MRLGAISLIHEFWKPTSAHDSACKQLLLTDPDLRVRAAAAYCWGKLHRRSCNREVGVALGSIAKDLSSGLELRCAAYIAFHDVLGSELPVEVLKSLFTAKETMPEDLDWSSIDSLVA